MYPKSGEINQDTNLGYQKVIEEKDRQISQLMDSIKIIDTQLKDAVKDVGTLQNINLGHQRAIKEKDRQISQLMDSIKIIDTQLKDAVNDIVVLHNTILEKDAALNDATKELQKLRHEIDAIHKSISWRALTPIKKRYDRILRVSTIPGAK